ncbi:cell wall elongation regulator TseB-like domain-containing protein [Paenibacillus mendelii]|uniref:DUF5590 domain-containing protein n=1 Tax=Paenibacillus mendelii TaxID=206163 RepID=A0ABV6JGT7_9BACL|nr:DUF5590 domain-containing protein [Paenibacillus mendelii]MCQ6557991.1 DUF5590 domain-containing protein [Paenibacillus mendelii]
MRATRRKRPSSMTPARIAAVVIASLIVLLIGANGYYRYVQAPLWNVQTKVEAQAMKAAALKETSDSYTYVWDETVWIVEGKDEQGDDVYVWLNEEQAEQTDITKQPVIRKVKEGFTKDQLKEKLLSSKPDADLEHIKLGWKDGQPVWELFYSRDQSGTNFYYYDFYRYSDGGYIITYSLPKQ